MRYEIIAQGKTVDAFDSFSQAVAYARANACAVYDCKAKQFIYDGYTDEYVADLYIN